MNAVPMRHRDFSAMEEAVLQSMLAEKQAAYEQLTTLSWWQKAWRWTAQAGAALAGFAASWVVQERRYIGEQREKNSQTTGELRRRADYAGHGNDNQPEQTTVDKSALSEELQHYEHQETVLIWPSCSAGCGGGCSGTMGGKCMPGAVTIHHSLAYDRDTMKFAESGTVHVVQHVPGQAPVIREATLAVNQHEGEDGQYDHIQFKRGDIDIGYALMRPKKLQSHLNTMRGNPSKKLPFKHEGYGYDDIVKHTTVSFAADLLVSSTDRLEQTLNEGTEALRRQTAVQTGSSLAVALGAGWLARHLVQARPQAAAHALKHDILAIQAELDKRVYAAAKVEEHHQHMVEEQQKAARA